MIYIHNRNLVQGSAIFFFGVIVLVFLIGDWYRESVEAQAKQELEIQRQKEKEWNKYYGVDIKFPLDELRPLESKDHLIVAGVDFTLQEAVQNIQNTNFDSIHLNRDQGVIYVNLFMPSGLKVMDHERFMFFQAMVYSIIIKKLLPKETFKFIGLTAYSREGVGYVRVAYDFDRMANLMRFGFIDGYEIANRKSKKATIE